MTTEVGEATWLMTRVAPEPAIREKFPFSSVWAATDEPFTRTVAWAMALSPATTRPVTFCWAKSPVEAQIQEESNSSRSFRARPPGWSPGHLGTGKRNFMTGIVLLKD